MSPRTSDLICSRVERLDALPTIPTILLSLLDYLEQPVEQLEGQKVADLVSCDPTLAAQCLRVANAPSLGRRPGVRTVRGAVTALGVQRLRDILLSCCLVGVLPEEKRLIDPVAFREHSLGCALVSRQLACKIGFPDPEKAYLAGLLHDLGEVVNSMSQPEEFFAAAELAFAEGMPLYEAERIIRGLTHCDSGRILAEHWGLPDEVKQVILYHHNVQQTKRHAGLVALVSLSDLLCRMRGLGDGLYESKQVCFLDDPAWSILIKEYPPLEQVDASRFAVEMDTFALETHALVTSIFRN